MERSGFRKCKEHSRSLLLLGCIAACDVAFSAYLLSCGFLQNFILCVCRLILLILGAGLAVHFGRGGQCVPGTAARDVERPLVADDQMASEQGDDLTRRMNADEELSKHSWKVGLLVGACFSAITIVSVYTGIQVTGLVSVDAKVATALCSTVFFMYVEFVMIKGIVTKLTSDEGMFLPQVHEHPLHYNGRVSFAFCSVCRQRIGPLTEGYQAFECKTCDGDTGGGKGGGKGNSGFHLCLLCYRKSRVSEDVQEGVLRGDKGPKHTPDLTAWDYMMRTLKLTAPFKMNFVAALAFILISTLSSVLLPNQQGAIINSLVANNSEEFAKVLTRFVLLSVTAALFNSLMSLTVNIVARQISLSIRSDMFESLIKQDLAFFDGVMTGQLTSRMTNDVGSVTQPIQQVMNTLLSNVIKLIGGTFMCFYTSWQLTMLALTMIGPVIYMTGIYAQWSKDINFSVRASMGDANATATESLKNIRTVRSFGAAKIETGVFDGYMASAWKNMKKDAYASAGVGTISAYVNFGAGVLVYWYGGKAVLMGADSHLNVGSLVTFNMYWNMLQNSITALNGMLNSLVVAASAAKRVYEIIDLQPDIKIDDVDADSLVTTVPVGQAPAIEFRDVHFTYQMRPDRKVFAGLSFTIPAGSSVAFVGKSGCGKSTCMQLLMRFYDTQQGEVLVGGRPLPEYNLKSYMQRIAVVSQETQVFARSVKDNLTYGMDPESYDDALIEWATRQANAYEFIMQMDRGFDSMLGESGGRLSGGQKQRLSIARAFLRRPQLLFLDEATSALDSENEKQIQQALDHMVAAMVGGSVSVVIIAHRLSTIMGCDNIIVMNQGQVYEQGNHAALMTKDGIYASLVKRQQAKESEADAKDGGDENKAGKGKSKKGGKGKGTGGVTVESDEPVVAASVMEKAADTGMGASVNIEQGKGKDGKDSGKGKWKGKCWQYARVGEDNWKKISDLTRDERRSWLKRKMHHVLQQALRGCGSDEVSDALLACVNDAIDNTGTDVEETQVEQPGRHSDNIAVLFQELMQKSQFQKDAS